MTRFHAAWDAPAGHVPCTTCKTATQACLCGMARNSLKSLRVCKIARTLQLAGSVRAGSGKEVLSQTRKDAAEEVRDRIIVRPAQ